MVEFNLNQCIEVQLTDQGRAEHRRQHEEYQEAHAGYPSYTPPDEDKDGWSRWQTWDLFSHFGCMLKLGSEHPFSMNVRLDIPERHDD